MAWAAGPGPRYRESTGEPRGGSRCFPLVSGPWPYGVMVVGVTTIWVRFRSFAFTVSTKVSGVALA
jgi:hypothetical protein